MPAIKAHIMTDSAAPEAPDASDAKLAKTQTQRARWATRKMTVKSSSSKRKSILNRMQHKRGSSNEKHPSGESPQPPADDEDEQAPAGSEQNDDDDQSPGRQLYVNIPLPDELLDDGHPLYTYPRNKIRTAKYTPLSFVPKNLYFQFQNVANIFFLFLIIMGVSFYLFL